MKFAKVPKIALPKNPWARSAIILIIIIILLPFAFYGAFRSARVQTWLASKATSYLSKELKADISIKGIDISWFMKITLEGLYLSDQKKDTILYVGKLGILPNSILYRQQIIDIHRLILEDAKINLKTAKGERSLNLQFLLDYFQSKDTTSSTAGKPWSILVHNLDLRSVSFKLDNDNYPRSDTGIDFSHLYLNPVNISLRNIRNVGDTIELGITNIIAREVHGFNLKTFNAEAKISPKNINLKNLVIETDLSDLALDLNFDFEEFNDFNDFIDKININASFLPSRINTRDITFFAPDIWGMNDQVLLSGDVTGKVNNMKLKDFNLEYGATSRFHGNLKMIGLPYIEETFINLDIKKLSTSTIDLEQIILPGGNKLSLPDQLKTLGKVEVSGKFTGFYNDFVSYANFRTSLGKVFTDISLKNNKELKRFEYQGTVKTDNFYLGKLLGIESIMKNLDMNAEIKGNGLTLKTLDIAMTGTIDSTDLFGKTYRKIDIAGAIKEETFTGSLEVIDPDLDLSFKGSVDFSEKHPAFHFQSDISHANLNHMNLVKSDTSYVIASSVIVNTEGLVLDSMQGKLNIDNLRLTVNHDTYQVKSFIVDMISRKGDYKEVSIKSDLLDGKLTGVINFQNLQSSFEGLTGIYLPSVFSKKTSDPGTVKQAFAFSADFRDPGPLTKVFLPGIEIAKNTTIQCEINNESQLVKLDVKSKLLSFGEKSVKDFYLRGNTQSGIFILETGCSKFLAGDVSYFDNLKLMSHARNDSVNFRLNWQNIDSLHTNNGDLGGTIALNSFPKIRISLKDSKGTINDTLWKVEPGNFVEIDSNYIHVQSLSITNGFSKLLFNGILSENPLDLFTVKINNFDVSNFDRLTVSTGFDFDGMINGEARILNVYHSPTIISDITIKKLSINGDILGDAVISSSWDSKESALFAGLDVIYKGNIGENQPIKLKGYYYPLREKNSLDFSADLSNFRLKSIQNLLSSFSSKLVGIASGHLLLKGSFNDIELSGNLKVQRGQMKIDYLNTTYSFSHEIDFQKDMISVDKMIAYDSLGNQAIINAKIMHHNFAEWKLDIDIQPKNFLAMNTRFIDNNLFYGKAFASGSATITGPVSNLVFDINAKISKGTQFFLPLNLTADVADKDYITFINHASDSIMKEPEKQIDLSGLTMNFNLDATPDGEINLYLPYDMGNIKARGEGRLNMNVDSKSNFGMLGEYKVTEGAYLFTLKNLFSRNFVLVPGGRIIFNGDVYTTKLDLRARYKMEASLSALKPAGGSTDPVYNEKVPLDIIIDLKGNLFNPEINFMLLLNENDPQINRIVYGQIDTTNQQQMSVR